MLKIAICDDDPYIANYVGELLQNYDSNLFDPFIYYEPQKLIKQMKEIDFDVYILDIETPELSGVEVADLIRQDNLNVPIIFLTSYQKYMEKVFKLQTFDYILKPLDHNYFFQVIDRAVRYLKVSNDRFNFSYKKADYRISLNNILYFEKNRRQVYIHVHSHDMYVSNMSTTEVISQLPATFVQVHTSFIINTDHIKEVGKNYVILNSNKNFIELPISRKFKTEALQKILMRKRDSF
ncbi:LytR/AlgR family response regulator transcription factor [Listeria innocua]|uniref:LytR/AlgR family response regulator transcription factor n=2 Tax=Listeria TaxID=1637 RepID=UPI00162A99A2|nr:LytTR family DNA-binding domain-containing protein [Listeria innocua]EAF4531102.1 response regulator transcription factor [Listeria monocytogenes serotype 1/2a]MBC1910468.1 response regulator transcription factor [Listeria innocua]MBC1925451.1 response regulator transcription factor [Listeria innocua]MBC1928799.1 response regulator transcription factor [Listeria innocua]